MLVAGGPVGCSPRAEIALATEGLEAGVAAARTAIEQSTATDRPKQQIASRIVFGRALFQLGDRDAAVQELRSAQASAQTLGHPASLWRAAEALAELCVALGDDRGASESSAIACAAVEGFAAGMTPEHCEHLLSAPAVAALLAAV